MLGKGGFGSVQVVTHRMSGEKYALKTVDLVTKDAYSLGFFMKEVEIMKRIDHPGIVRLNEVYQTPEYLFLVMDLYDGGNLLESYTFRSEADCAKMMKKLVGAVRYCHDKGIAHRDLKLDNILLQKTTDEKDPDIKLVDFGLSIQFDSALKLENSTVGTWLYMAPEVIVGTHLPIACDMWSLGIIAYLLICGYPPFEGKTVDELKWQVKCGKYSFRDKYWGNISAIGKNFIKRLLVRNPQERMTAAEAQHHPWINDADVSTKPLPSEVVANLDAFKKTCLVKKLALSLMARTLEPQHLEQLSRDFRNMDLGDSGEVSLPDFRKVLKESTKHHRSSNRLNMEAEMMFDSMDLNGAGKVCFNDFLAASLARRELDEGRLRVAFDRLDYDHDGYISIDDLELTCGSDSEDGKLSKALAEVDINGDGLVEFWEFARAMRVTNSVGNSQLAVMASKSIAHMSQSDIDKVFAESGYSGAIPRPSVYRAKSDVGAGDLDATVPNGAGPKARRSSLRRSISEMSQGSQPNKV
ncbi:unnamed protein product [Chrysoparadoxa australica]